MLNIFLATRLALRNLRHHLLVSAATVLGVAIGMTVVSAVLIVDKNTARQGLQLPEGRQNPMEVFSVSVVRSGGAAMQPPMVPTQEKQESTSTITDQRSAARGEDDYQAMRLAVRLASLFAFSIGTVLVFYTMRYSVASRSRAFSLLMCLGEFRSNIALSLAAESLLLGATGTALGFVGGIPVARYLLWRGVSTTGRQPLAGFAVPWEELVVMAIVSVLVALLGIVGPVRSLFRLRVSEVLHPRFIAEETREGGRGVLWLLPPLVAATYVIVRPFLQSWLSVVEFFVFESIFVVGLTVITLMWVKPLLRFALYAFDLILRPFFPLETLLIGRRMRLTSEKIASSIIGITLVFALLTGLRDITKALKLEISNWADSATKSRLFYRGEGASIADAATFKSEMGRAGFDVIRLSRHMPGEFPVRLIKAEDVNPLRQVQGRPPLRPGAVVLSKSLAARFGVRVGDTIEVSGRSGKHRFEAIEIADDVGYFPEGQSYLDEKTYAVFSDGNPLFADNLEPTLGQFAVVLIGDAPQSRVRSVSRISSTFFLLGSDGLGRYRVNEIDRDFMIFDFVMAMTIVLAAVGVTNTLLIQVHARGREFSVLRTVGISRLQISKLLLIEGGLIGLLSAVLALGLGHALGMISVAFLDRFTLFEYAFSFSIRGSLAIFALTVGTCCIAAIYPASVATRPSTSESLHYE
jgi:putative ABC transport system permease protein